MAAISTAGSGNWSSIIPNAPWPLGTLPTNADDVTILNTHTVTQDSLTAVAFTITVNSGGALALSTLSSGVLTVQRTITIASGGTFTGDISAVPAITHSVITNNVQSAAPVYDFASADGSFITAKGAAKTRWTKLNGAVLAAATTITVDDATGWVTGDKIVLATTQAFNTTPKTDICTGTNTVTGNVITNMTALTNDHADDCWVGNLTSNLRFYSGGVLRTAFTATIDTTPAGTKTFSHVMFERNLLNITGGGGTTPASAVYANGVRNCSFYQFTIVGLQIANMGNTTCERSDNIFYSDAGTLTQTGSVVGAAAGANTGQGADTDMVVFRAGFGIDTPIIGHRLIRPKFSGCRTAGIGGSNVMAGSVDITEGDFHSNNIDWRPTGFSRIHMNGGRMGTQFGGVATSGNSMAPAGFADLLLTDVDIQASNVFSTTLTTSCQDATQVVFANKNGDPLVQETYTNLSTSTPTIARDNSFFFGASGSSIKVNTNAIVRDITFSFQIPAPNNQTVSLSGLIYRDNQQAGTVTLSGLGITPSVYTLSAANNTWEQFLVGGMNTTGTDSAFDITVVISSGNTGSVWLDSFSPSQPDAVNTGDFTLWYNGAPFSLLMSNFVAAIDVLNTQTSQLTLAGSIGKILNELCQIHGLDTAAPMHVSAAARSAGAVNQTITGTDSVTVQRV